MVEIIHEHDARTGDGSGMGVMVGVLLAIGVILFLFYYFGRGYLGGANTTPQINVPDKMDVNVNQTK